MPYKHPNDRRAQRRRYYQEHRKQILEQSAEWYETHKGDASYMDRKRQYMVLYRRRKKFGQ